MKARARVVSGIATAVLAVFALLFPTGAHLQAQATTPSVKDPVRFSAFGVQMQSGLNGSVDIVIERWTTDAERQSLLAVLGGASFKMGGQEKLLTALQKVKPRAGYIRTSRTLGWDIQYAKEFQMPDGERQIVIATDKHINSFAMRSDPGTVEYPFTLIEVRLKADGKGEGRLMASTAAQMKDGRLQLENYGLEPVRLTSVTQEKPKGSN